MEHPQYSIGKTWKHLHDSSSSAVEPWHPENIFHVNVWKKWDDLQVR